MPLFVFSCEHCHETYDRFIKGEDYPKEKTLQVCPKCHGTLTRVFTVPHIPSAIPGCASMDLRVEREMNRYHEAQQLAHTVGITKTEREEGIAGMQDYEKKHGLPSGSVTGDRGYQYETVKDAKGKPVTRLTPESSKKATADAKARVKISQELRKTTT